MTNDLNIQTPGQTGDTEATALTGALEGTVAEIAAGLEDYSDADLVTLATLEAEAKDRTPRKGVSDAIAHEQRRRAKLAAEDQDEQADASQPPVHDYHPGYKDPETAYRHLSASQVDATKITQRVLTKDGWVMPRPSANPVG